jgi:hypothetical protein
MERVLDPQFDNFLQRFTPGSQYGFRKSCGTQDYGAALCMKLHAVIEANLEAILISLDVAGAFDKVWWAALLANLRHCGMRGRAHRLMSSYLIARFLCVVSMGSASKVLQFFCGVPQGAIWSPKLWNFHMRELPSSLRYAIDFNYADDSALLKVFGQAAAKWTADHFSKQSVARYQAIQEVNIDLEALYQFGLKWKITFEPTKTHALLISNTPDCCFPAFSQVVFGGAHIIFEEELTLVGFVIDRKLTFKPMVDKVASKARMALGAMRRLKSLLGSSDLAVLYKAFVRSIIEYGLLEYIAAAPSRLSKLDRIQSSAEKLCGIQFTPLTDRREAAGFGLICKLLDGMCIEQLQQMCPVLSVEIFDQTNIAGRTRNRCAVGSECGPHGLRLKLGSAKAMRLDSSQRSFAGQMNVILNKVPTEILQLGLDDGWMAAMKRGQRCLGGSKPAIKEVKLPKDEYLVEKVIGYEVSDDGVRYLIVWKDYDEATWEWERNVIGAKRAVSEFWVELGEEQPESALLQQVRHNTTDAAAARSYEAQMNQDLMFRG